MTFTQNRDFRYIIFILFWLIVGYFIGIYVTMYLPTVTVQNSQNIISNEEIFLTDKIKKSMNIIRKYSYGFEQKSTIEIEDAVLKSVVDWLWDKHSTYFTKKETEEFEEALRGDFEWIGAVINDNPRWIKIMKIIAGSPAEKAGLKAWDIMTKVGDVNIVGKTTEEAVKSIRWPKGTIANITYKRWEDNTELFVSVTRDKVNVPSVWEKMLDKKIGYIEIATFGEHTWPEFVKSWNNLVSSGAQWIILDFRNNGWGYLDTAIELASVIFPKNTPIVTIKENDPKNTDTKYTSAFSKINITMPIIVLINDYSASASEIFAGAVQDHGRWILLGEKSYGKWSVQEPFDLGDGSIMKITTARWYTPKDKSIDIKGITPDVYVVLTNKDYDSIFDRQLEAAKVIMNDQITSKMWIPDIKEKYKSNNFTELKK